jgi:hypothetical protein
VETVPRIPIIRYDKLDNPEKNPYLDFRRWEMEIAIAGATAGSRCSYSRPLVRAVAEV